MVSVKERMERVIEEMVENGVRLSEAIRDFEKKYVAAALHRAKGNQIAAAKILGVHRNTLGKKVNGNGHAHESRKPAPRKRRPRK